MTYIHPLTVGVDGSADLLGAKAYGLLVLRRLGLPVPAGFVIDTRACRAFLLSGRFPEELDAELATAVRSLEAATERPLAVSVRSGAAVSMPGMMNTILNLGLTTDAMGHLRAAVRAVLSSWNTPRATTYRELHGIPHDLGTAVIVQAMVFGNADRRSGTGVAFSRDPNTGEKEPYGDVLFGRQGEDVVSGQSTTRPLTDLAHRAPAVWGDLRAALHRIEQHYRDACHVEFTFEAGRLWLLQVRSGGLTGRAAIRVAVDLADEHLIDRRTALRRVSPHHLRLAHTPRIRTGDGFEVFARGRSASPGVATGRIAVTADRAARMAAGGPVILVRPTTSPLDIHGLAAADGIVTSRGGPTSHAAVVARAMGKPAVVDATALTVDTVARSVRAGERVLDEGTTITLDGTSGEIVIGDPGTVTATTDRHLDRLLTWADAISGDRSRRSDEQRLSDAHARLRDATIVIDKPVGGSPVG
jgi:pyruvate,orthophosphate dikinase